MTSAIDIDRLREELVRDEGMRLKPYTDSVGKLSIGVGRNLTDVGISRIEAEDLLINDIVERLGALSHRLPWSKDLDDVRMRALVNLSFMGIEKLLGFHKMLEALRRQAWDTAAAELLNSKYAGQVGQRAVRLAAMLRTSEVSAPSSKP